MSRKKNLKTLQERIGYEFKNERLLIEALCHRSYLNENRDFDTPHNERLEFLGDAIVGFITSTLLLKLYPAASEGWLTKARAGLVMASSLARFARDWQLGEFALLGKGEERNEGRTKEKLLADLFEAIIGAVFLDSGIRAAERIIRPLMRARLKSEEPESFDHDYKSQLQELTMQRWAKLPRYVLEHTEGPEHQKMFTMSVWVRHDALGKGAGRSKKIAQQLAARDALLLLTKKI